MCLGHALKGVAGTYRQYAYLPEKAAALQRWADNLQAVCMTDVTASRNAVSGANQDGSPS